MRAKKDPQDYCIPLILRGLMRDAAFRRRKWFEAEPKARYSHGARHPTRLIRQMNPMMWG